MSILRKIFPSKNDKILRNLRKITQRVNALEAEVAALKDADFPKKTLELKEKIEKGASRNDILPMGFALVREAAKRTLGMRHFDVQIMGGIVLLDGKVSEMSTGEGKTLVATLPSYVIALEGKGAHIVTVNDYLAKRDALWMGQVFEFLGLSVGIVQSEMGQERREEYKKDITYVTNNELGFDYLRDNMRGFQDPPVLRPFHFALVDEVDSILIDEARTPLIISGPSDSKETLCGLANIIVKSLTKEHYDVDEKNKSITLTEEGMSFVEKSLKDKKILAQDASLYDIENATIVHFITQALKAWKLFVRNKDYIIKDNKVLIIDEFTGRIMDGRRFSDNLHQAIEAKENVPILRENQTLASVTYQNLFRLYKTLAGMSGTVMTEQVEFGEIYKLSCVTLPTNKPLVRKDFQDLLFATLEEKTEAIIQKIKSCHAKNQPVLIGTVSIEKSELFSRALKKAKIPHSVLNAKNHRKEASIIARAGEPGAVTIATNMAGRGTDIKLGGNVDFQLEEIGDKASKQKREDIVQTFEKNKAVVLEAGGLCIIGTERHESRRIDNQLRGRSGRQGDAGESVFFLCLEDDLMRIFAGDKLQFLMSKMKTQKGEPIEHKLISRSIERAQGRVEAQNYEVRKHLLNFDDVSNNQREMVYTMRREIINKEKDICALMREHISDCVKGLLKDFFPSHEISPKSMALFIKRLSQLLHNTSFDDITQADGLRHIEKNLIKILEERLIKKCTALKEEELETLCHFILATIDNHWRHHLSRIDNLKQGINLRSYAQGSPLVEFKKEAFDLFLKFLGIISLEIVCILFNHLEEVVLPRGASQQASVISPPSSRNSPCPCGSGKKYKHCHGNLSSQ